MMPVADRRQSWRQAGHGIGQWAHPRDRTADSDRLTGWPTRLDWAPGLTSVGAALAAVCADVLLTAALPLGREHRPTPQSSMPSPGWRRSAYWVTCPDVDALIVYACGWTDVDDIAGDLRLRCSHPNASVSVSADAGMAVMTAAHATTNSRLNRVWDIPRSFGCAGGKSRGQTPRSQTATTRPHSTGAL
jgi:hypothetical protein